MSQIQPYVPMSRGRHVVPSLIVRMACGPMPPHFGVSVQLTSLFGTHLHCTQFSFETLHVKRINSS